MSGNNINVEDNKVKKSGFYKNKQITKIDNIDVNKILVFKKKHTAQRIHLNALLDIVIMI